MRDRTLATPGSQPPTLNRVTMALYGVGALGNAARQQIGGMVLLFYNQIIGIDARLIGLAAAISMFIDAFGDPIIGQISDKTNSRLGRRHPYMFGAAIPAAICFTLIFIPPRGWSQNALFLYILVVVVFNGLLTSLQGTPNGALMPELTSDYDKRTTLQSYRYFFGSVIGAALSVVLGYGVFLRGTKAQPFGQLNEAGYAPYAATVAAIGAVAMLISAFATWRFVPYLHKPPRRTSLSAIAREAGLALSNRNFVTLVAYAMLFAMAGGVTRGLATYFYTYFWELPSSALLQLILWTIPAGLLGVVGAPLVAKALGKKGAALAALFATILTTSLPILGRLLGIMPANGSPWILPILIADTIVTSALSVMGAVMVGSMLSDVVEDTQVRSGRRSEGLLFSVDTMLQKVVTSFAALFPGLVIAIIHFPTHAHPGRVDATVLRHLAIIYLPVIVALNAVATSILLFYRIDRSHHEENLSKIAVAAALLEDVDPNGALASQTSVELWPSASRAGWWRVPLRRSLTEVRG